MRQLTGLDASFLYLETPNAPMHIAGLAIYDPSTAPGGKVRFKQILQHTLERSAEVSTMSAKLKTVPFSMDHPYWINDGHFDPEFHVRHIALPKPGDWRQLCIQVARLQARALDRNYPLWETYIIEGLDNIEGYPKGCFAVYSKVHHAAVDGASGVELTAATHDLTPESRPADTNAVIEVDSDPGAIELVLRAQLNNLRQPFRAVSVARNNIPGVARAFAGLRSGKLERIKNVPRTRFNSNVSPHRVFDVLKVDFEDIRRIKNSIEGITVNDVAIAICGGALRKYLLDKNELPADSLVAMAPINVRSEDQKKTGGNQVGTMSVKICSDVEDAIGRLKAVNEGTRNAKALTNAIGAKAMTDVTQFTPSMLAGAGARAASRMGLANFGTPQYNCVITNVPGPQVPLYYAGAQMKSNFGLGPVLDGNGLFQAIGTYCGEFTICFTACREMMPDPDFYSRCLRESFDELLAATAALDAETPAKKRKAAPKKKAATKAKTAAA